MRAATVSPYALIVDDEPLVRAEAAAILREEGFETLEACNVSEALAMLERSGAQFQLLITDIQLSGQRDGVQLAQLCAQRWPHVAILVVSGFSGQDMAELPADAVFSPKPLGGITGRAKLRSAIERAATVMA